SRDGAAESWLWGANGAHPRGRMDHHRPRLRAGAPLLGVAPGVRSERRRPAFPERKIHLQAFLQGHPLRGTAAGSPGRSPSVMSRKGSLEREIKFPGVELDKLRGRLAELEAERVGPAAFEDNWILDK